MTLFEIHADVARVATALERIVFLLEKLVFPPEPAEVKVQQATLDDLRVVSPEVTERMHEAQMRFAEFHRVVPNSEAFAYELLAWEEEQRSIHGENWEPPDWAEIFASAYRGTGPGPKPAPAPAPAAD